MLDPILLLELSVFKTTLENLLALLNTNTRRQPISKPRQKHLTTVAGGRIR